MDGGAKLALGLGLCLLGIVITVATYSAAAGGGSYVVMYGPVIFGAIMAFRGAAEMKNEGEAAATDPVTAPVMLSGSIDADDYPESACDDRAEGRVTLGFVVDPTGQPLHVEVLTSSGNAALDETAVRLMGERFRFDPAKNARGEPVEAYHKTSIRWELPDDVAAAWEVTDHVKELAVTRDDQSRSAPTTASPSPPPEPG